MSALSVRVVLCLSALVLACSPLRDNDAVPAQLGEACVAVEECAAGLVCTQEGTCQPVGEPGTAGREEPCATDLDCQIQYVCGGAGRCNRSREGDVADVCTGDASCAAGLRCGNNGRCARDGDPGTTGDGEACGESSECGFGLICGAGALCTPVPQWSGVECVPEEGETRLLFEVPRGVREGDFFRLPYPNDVLRAGNRLNLAGYPGTEQRPEPGDAIAALLAATRQQTDGFSLNPAITFRFSRSIDFETLEFGTNRPNFIFVDITPDSESRGRRPRARFFATTDSSRYICNNWLAIRPSEGTPLEAGHTYAVLFLTGLLDTSGDPLVPDADFLAITGNQRPRFPTLAAAWDRYQPLKAWLDEEGILPEELIGGTVFTTGNPRRPMAAMRAAVLDAAPPSLESLAVCDRAASPCDNGPDRHCGDTAGLVEIHGLVRLSNFLNGAAPFTAAGGSMTFVDGAPRLQRREEICVALTVPEGERPAGGWPLVIFGHAEGGNFRSNVSTGLAEQLAQLGWASLSYDGVMQGARAGLPTPPDGEAVMTTLNTLTRPGLARDHALQAAADLHGLVQLVPQLQEVVDGVNLGFDRDKLVFIGHGLGGELGLPAVAYAPEFKAVVLASVGGSLMDRASLTLLPANLNAQYSVALAEPRLDGMHPGMHLAQTWLDTRDPMNYAPLLREPPPDVPLKHVFQLYGLNDSIVPNKAQGYLAVAGRFGRIGRELEEVVALQAVTDSTGGANVNGPDGTVFTQVFKQYPTQEGHQVLFEAQAARRDLADFMTAIGVGEAPTIRQQQ